LRRPLGVDDNLIKEKVGGKLPLLNFLPNNVKGFRIEK